MAKKNYTRITSLLLAVVLAFGMICFNTGTVSAATKYEVGMSDTVYVGEDNGVYVYNAKTFKDMKVVSVKSSDTTIAKPVKRTVYFENNKKSKVYFLNLKKAGEVKLTIKFKKSKNKYATIKKKITVKDYPNHIKKLTVNGKNINLTKDENKFFVAKKCKTTKPKVKIDIAEGWKIQSVDAYAYKTSSGKKIKVTKSMLKSGKAFSFPKKYKYMNVGINFVNEAGDMIYYSVDLYR